MKKKRNREPDLRKAREATGGGGGSFYHPYPAPEKCCGECQQLRSSVDDSGRCEYCRAAAKAKRPQADATA